MIGYIFLDAWLLTLVILGIIVVSTGIPEEESEYDMKPRAVWCAKMTYLVLLAGTMYKMGEHFANL